MRALLLVAALATSACSLAYDFDGAPPEGLSGAVDAAELDAGDRADAAVEVDAAVEPDAAADMALEIDAAADMAVELDAAPDMAVEPDAAPDMAVEPDATPDMAVEPDAAPDMAVEPDAAPDMAVEPDAAPDMAVEPDAAGCEGEGSPCTVGVGECAREGIQVCVEDGDECDVEPGEPGEEICDRVDNDCDGEADEGFAVGEACAVGVGGCLREGERICADDGTAFCDARPGAPGDELCGNLEDDDCDGRTDESFPEVGGECAVGVGACRATGLFQCNEAGDGLMCPADAGAPVAESCSGRDDDCDGEVDEVAFDPARAGPITQGANILAGWPALAHVRTGVEDRFLVAWSDDRDGEPRVFARVVGADGRLVSAELVLSGEGTSASVPAAVGTPTGFTVAWSEDGPIAGGVDREARMVHLDASGRTVWGPNSFGEVGSAPFEPQVAFTGGRYLMVWTDNRDVGARQIYGALVTNEGVQEGEDIQISEDLGEALLPVVVGGDAVFGVAWQDDQVQGRPEIFFTRVDERGQRLARPLRVSSNGTPATHASIASRAGDRFGIAWRDDPGDDGDIYFARVDAGGVVDGLRQRVIDGPSAAQVPSLVGTPNGWALVWHDDRFEAQDVLFTELSAEGVRGSIQRLGLSPEAAFDPALVWTGAGYAASWADLREDVDGGEIYFLPGGCPEVEP